jgi:acylphosphatase
MSGGRSVREDGRARLSAVVHGRVQGVGFRWWTRCRAAELALDGHARNLPDGRVEVVAEGTRDGCERLLELLRHGPTPGHVDRVTAHWHPPTGLPPGFVER